MRSASIFAVIVIEMLLLHTPTLLLWQQRLPYLHYRDYWLVLPKYGSSSVARTCACQLVKGWDHIILLLSPDPLAGTWHLAYDPLAGTCHLAYDPLSGTTPLCFCTNLPVLRHPPSSPTPLVLVLRRPWLSFSFNPFARLSQHNELASDNPCTFLSFFRSTITNPLKLGVQNSFGLKKEKLTQNWSIFWKIFGCKYLC